MRRNVAFRGLIAAMVSGVVAQNATQTLASLCTVAYVQSILPATNFIEGVAVNVDSVAASAVTNYTVAASDGMLGGSGYDFCNVTFSYTHTGLNDTVSLPFYKVYGLFPTISIVFFSCVTATLTKSCRFNFGIICPLLRNGRVVI